MTKELKRKSIKKDKENGNKLTKPRFVFTLIGMVLGLICIFIGSGMLVMVYNYESNGISAYGLISPGLFAIGAGLFQILAFFFRKSKKLWKNCTLFSLICIVGVSISFTVVYIGYLNPLGSFIGTLTFFIPVIICQIVILTTDVEFHKKNLKEFKIERGKPTNDKEQEIINE